MILCFVIDPNISFTYEVEKDCKLPFFDVFLIKRGSKQQLITKQAPMTFTLTLNIPIPGKVEKLS